MAEASGRPTVAPRLRPCAGQRFGLQFGRSWELGAWLARAAWLLLPVLSEYERLRSEELGREGGLLAYQGSARDVAACTDQGD